MSAPKGYYANKRVELVEPVESNARRVLEIGCGSGNTLAAIKQERQANEVWGVEMVPEAAQKAAENPVLDRVICGDIADLLDELPHEGFSHIIAGDVLEHLVDPWAILKALRLKLEPGGKISSSIPNIRTISFFSKLLFTKRFEYKDSGVMDITHLRFFARKDIKIMFADAGYSNIEITALTPGKNALKRLGRAVFGDLVLKRFLITATRN